MLTTPFPSRLLYSANKYAQVILEEYAISANQATIYQGWADTIISTGLTGELFWYASTALSPSQIAILRLFYRQACTTLADGTFYYDVSLFLTRRSAFAQSNPVSVIQDSNCIYPTSATYPTMVEIVEEIKAANSTLR